MGRLTNTDAMDALVQAAQQDNRAAFRQLYERYKQRVFRTANRLLNDHGWAEDVTQEVFMTVYQQLSTFDFRSSFKTWCPEYPYRPYRKPTVIVWIELIHTLPASLSRTQRPNV